MGNRAGLVPTHNVVRLFEIGASIALSRLAVERGKVTVKSRACARVGEVLPLRRLPVPQARSSMRTALPDRSTKEPINGSAEMCTRIGFSSYLSATFE